MTERSQLPKLANSDVDGSETVPAIVYSVVHESAVGAIVAQLTAPIEAD